MFSDLPDWRNIKGVYLFKENHKHKSLFSFQNGGPANSQKSLFKLWMGWEEEKKKKNQPVMEGGEKK